MTELLTEPLAALESCNDEARFQRELENTTGLKLKLRINDNSSTMLSVRKESEGARVSIHRMFLDAPQNIMQKLACYIIGKDREIGPEIRSYIETGLRDLDYSHKVRPQAIHMAGQVYDLEQILSDVNQEYFAGEANVAITWFGNGAHRPRTRLTFGLYNEALKLVKIHRRLDSAFVPLYVVRFVVYHEVLHHMCPGYVDARGHNRVHHPEFRRREQLFNEHDEAQAWIKENQSMMFRR